MDQKMKYIEKLKKIYVEIWVINQRITPGVKYKKSLLHARAMLSKLNCFD